MEKRLCFLAILGVQFAAMAHVRDFSEDRWAIKVARERRLYLTSGDADLLHFDHNVQVWDLLSSELAAWIRGSHLTPPQAHVFGFHLSGFTFGEIGVLRDSSKQNCQTLFAKAQRKLIAAHEFIPATGLADTYRELTLRGGGILNEDVLNFMFNRV